MRSTFFTSAILALTLAVSGCSDKKPLPSILVMQGAPAGGYITRIEGFGEQQAVMVSSDGKRRLPAARLPVARMTKPPRDQSGYTIYNYDTEGVNPQMFTFCVYPDGHVVDDNNSPWIEPPASTP